MKLQPATLIRRAELLSELLPREGLHPTVLKWADLENRGSKRVIALSGGADSVALLVSIWALWPEGRDRLQAVHFNHRLRGRASDGDEKFCRELCAALSISLWVGRRRVTQKIVSEAEARELRFAYIDRNMRRVGAQGLWLGHQQNDIAETMLMRLSRGSGAGGLAAPRPVQSMPQGRVNVRPLLNLQRTEIEGALRTAKLPWREDASNRGDDYFRNRIRNVVLPAWVKASGRDALAGAALSRKLIEEDDTALEDWAERLYTTMPAGKLRLVDLEDVPMAVLRRVLYRWLSAQPKAGELSRQAFEQLLERVRLGESTRQSLGREGFALIRKRVLSYESVISRRKPVVPS